MFEIEKITLLNFFISAVMDRKNEMSTVVEEDSDDSSVLSEPESLKIKVSNNKLLGNYFFNSDPWTIVYGEDCACLISSCD